MAASLRPHYAGLVIHTYILSREVIDSLPVATLTVTGISGSSENPDRPCPGDTVVYTCNQSGITLRWDIPGVFLMPLAYVVDVVPDSVVGAIQTDPTSGSETNLTAIGDTPASLTSTLTITMSNNMVQNGSTIECTGAQSLTLNLNIASECCIVF